MRLALVVGAADAPDQAGFFHAAQRDDGSGLHHADAGGELALRETILVPQHAQEIPLAARDTMGCDAFLQQALECTMRIAHEIAAALRRGKIALRRAVGGSPVLLRFAGHVRILIRACRTTGRKIDKLSIPMQIILSNLCIWLAAPQTGASRA